MRDSETFDELYPDAPTWFQPDDPWNEVIKVPSRKECWQCTTRTYFCELNFEAHVCSPECNDKGWAEYFRACEASGIPEPPRFDEES